MNRTGKSLKNSIVAASAQICILLASFVGRTVFIRTLNTEYLGLNGLFSNILSMLSFAELGIGTAITYSLYKPISENDEDLVDSIISFFKRVYRWIGIGILLAGIALSIFVPRITKSNIDSLKVQTYFVLYLLSAVVSYFFAYKRTILIAHEKGYKDSLNQLVTKFGQTMVQILCLIMFKSFIAYLIIQIGAVVFSNLHISKIADKEYPNINYSSTKKIPRNVWNSIKHNVGGMITSKVSSLIVLNTDNLLITAFVNITAVGLYSNYVLITNAASQVIGQLINAVAPNIGHDLIEKDVKHNYEVFEKVFFLDTGIAIFVSTVIASLINPFIVIWIGKSFLLSDGVALIIALNFFLSIYRQTAVTYVDASGLFWNLRYKQIVEAVLNLIFTLLFLAKGMGIFGVVLGTSLSTLFTSVWWEPYVVFHELFKKASYKYQLLTIGNIVLFLLDAKICSLIAASLFSGTFVSFIIIAILTLFLNGAICAAYMFFSPAKALIVKLIQYSIRNKL